MKIVYLVRHGQAVDDVENLFGGAADHKPTEKALKEAEDFANNFPDKTINLIISSPYLRAKVPASIVAEKWNVPLEVEENLRERNQYGILTGMNKDEAAKKYPKLVAELKKPGSQVEGAEDNTLFRQRVKEAMDKIWERQEENILVFTHMGPMLAALDKHFGDFEAGHFAWLKVTKKDGRWTILESRGVTFK